jgi:hypothetical protein
MLVEREGMASTSTAASAAVDTPSRDWRLGRVIAITRTFFGSKIIKARPDDALTLIKPTGTGTK